MSRSPAADAGRQLRIGELARRAGFTTRTIRYYESIGLLRPAGRSRSGYRLYAGAALDRLAFVRRSQGLGLRLADIRRILEISDEGRAPCQHVVKVVEHQLARIDEQMERLLEMRQRLQGLRRRLRAALRRGDVRPGEPCPCFGEETIDERDL